MSKQRSTDFYEEPSRARRRREKENAITRAGKYIKQNNYWFPRSDEEVIDEARRRADNFQICSCYMCGNQRKNFLSNSEERMTLVERKAWLDLIDQYEEIYIKLPTKRPGKVNGK